MSKPPTPRVETVPGGSAFSVRAVPGASADGIAGEADGALRVRIAAPPLDDRANRRLVKFLSKALKVPESRLEIEKGRKSKVKKITVSGMTPDALSAGLEELMREKKVEK